MSRVLITGADGMLGWDLRKAFPDATATNRQSLDITQPEAIAKALDSERPAVVINAAAYTGVDAAETARDRALEVNATAVGHLTQACRDRRIRFLHFSTDQVFDGRSEAPYDETAPPSPANFYAETKWRGEQAALGYDRSVVLRVQWLYGQRKDRFTPLREKKTFSPFSDQIGTPTWTREIARVTVELVAREASGLYHLAYDDPASWAEVYRHACREMGLATELIPRRTADAGLPARRPLHAVLSNAKLARFLGRKLGSWRPFLTEFLRSHE